MINGAFWQEPFRRAVAICTRRVFTRKEPLSILRSRWFLISILGFTFSLPSLTVAEEPAGKTEQKFLEPIIIEETMPNAPGELTLRLTTDYRENGAEAIGALPRFQLFYGLVDRLGTSLSVPMTYNKSDGSAHYGLGDLSLDLKYLLLRPGPTVPALVVGIEAGFPTGNQNSGLGEGAYEMAPFVGLLKDFGPVCLQGNFGWSKEITGARTDRVTYGWALSVPIEARKLYLLAELQGDFGSPNHVTIAPGVKYLVCDNFSLGLAGPLGLNSHTETWGIVTQFQFEF